MNITNEIARVRQKILVFEKPSIIPVMVELIELARTQDRKTSSVEIIKELKNKYTKTLSDLEESKSKYRQSKLDI